MRPRPALFLLAGLACAANDVEAPPPLDATLLEGFWILTPALDSTKRLLFSGLESDSPAQAHFTTASLLWGAAFYTGTATVSADSLRLDVRPPRGPGPVIEVTYAYAVSDSDLTLVSDMSSEVYRRIP